MSGVIDLEGNVWVWGKNDRGNLGLGDWTDRFVPTKITDFNASQISVGYNCIILIGKKTHKGE